LVCAMCAFDPSRRMELEDVERRVSEFVEMEAEAASMQNDQVSLDYSFPAHAGAYQPRERVDVRCERNSERTQAARHCTARCERSELGF